MAIQSLGLHSPTNEKRSILDNPAVPLSSPIAWEFISGGHHTDAAETVTPHTAMQVAAVNACVNLIADSISSLPLVLYRRTGNGKQEAAENPLHRLLSIEPNLDNTAATFWNGFIVSMLLWGNGYAEITRNAGQITGLWLIDPRTITIKRLPSDGSLIYVTTEGGKTRNLKASDVLHVPAYVGLDSATGMSVIQQARSVIGHGIALDKFGSRFFANFAMPQLALLVKKLVKPEDKVKMRHDWEALQSGSNAHRMAILDQEMDIKTLSVPPEDAQFLETKKLSMQQICGLFRVHPSQIGDISRVAGETYAGQQITFLRDCLRNWMVKIRQEVIRKLLPQQRDYTVDYDLRDLLKVDQKTLSESIMTARQAGLLTTDEGREMAGFNPLGGDVGDLVLAPVNMCDARALVGKGPSTTQKEVPNEQQ